MYKYKITPVSSTRTIRSAHVVVDSPVSNKTGELLVNHYAEGNELWIGEGESWLRIETMDGQPKAGWVAVTYYNGKVLCTLTENTVTPPPPPTGLPAIDVNITLKADGYPDKTIVDTWNPL